MRDDTSLDGLFAGSEEAERRRKVELLSDEDLRQLHASLHATHLINETLWVPLIEDEMKRRGVLWKN